MIRLGLLTECPNTSEIQAIEQAYEKARKLALHQIRILAKWKNEYQTLQQHLTTLIQLFQKEVQQKFKF